MYVAECSSRNLGLCLAQGHIDMEARGIEPMTLWLKEDIVPQLATVPPEVEEQWCAHPNANFTSAK